jgi:hypothetical protein
MRQGKLSFPLTSVHFRYHAKLTIKTAGRYLPEYHVVKGTHDFFETCRDPEIASTLTLQPIERFGGLIDAAIIFSDILVIPQAMGMEVVMVDKKGPHFPSPLKSPKDGQYEEVMKKDVDVEKELDYVYKAITLTRKKLQGRVPLIGFCGAPWTLLCYMVEGGGSKIFKEVKTWIYKYPQATKDLLQKIAELCVEYLALQVQAGAQVCPFPLSTRYKKIGMVGMFANGVEIDDTSLRFLGRRTLPHLLQNLLPPVPKNNLRSTPFALTIKRSPRCPNDRFRKRRLVCPRGFVQDEL